MGPDPSGLSSLEQGSCALCGFCPLEAIRWYLVTTREWRVLVPGQVSIGRGKVRGQVGG